MMMMMHIQSTVIMPGRNVDKNLFDIKLVANIDVLYSTNCLLLTRNYTRV